MSSSAYQASVIFSLLFLVVLCASAALLSGCAQYDAVVEVVLPNGFKGEVRIVLDPAGAAVSSNGSRMTYEIPARGVVHVQSLLPFTEWHALVVKTKDGRKVPLGGELSEAYGASQSFAWSGVARKTDTASEITYFIGTQGEYADWLSRQ